MLHPLIVGIDESGRGAWAGPVVAAACCLDPARAILGVADSKQLSERRREALYRSIRAQAFAVGVGAASPEEIDALGILPATFLAMRRAVLDLGVRPDQAEVDGPLDPGLALPTRTVVRGDSLVPAISAASIIAKVCRDRWMRRLGVRYPGYGFEQHKGYGTTTHRRALDEQGPCALHRQTFAPIRERMTEGGVMRRSAAL